MENKKPIYQSVTIWGALATIVTGIYLMVNGNMVEGGAAVASGLFCLWGRIRAKKSIG